MLPLGLQFQSFKTTKKLPMRLETLTLEEQKNHFFKMIGLEGTPETKTQTKTQMKTQTKTQVKTKRNKLRKNKTMKSN